MKPTVLLLLLSLIFISCSKDDDPNEFDNVSIDIDLFEINEQGKQQRISGNANFYLFDASQYNLALKQDESAYLEGYALTSDGKKIAPFKKSEGYKGFSTNYPNTNKYLVLIYSHEYGSYTSFFAQPIKNSRVYYSRTLSKESGYEESTDSNLKVNIEKN